MGVAPELAFAQNMFTPSSNDMGLQLTGAIFGSLAGTGNSDAMAAPMQVFMGAILIVAGLLHTYTILKATIGTAHDGSFMGKAYNAAFTPIRFAVFTALILPVKAGSYCAMQMIVYWLVIQGVGLADMAWSAYLATQNIGQSMTASVTPPSVTELTYKTLESLTCLVVIQNTMKGPAADMLNGGSEFGTSTDTGTVNNFIYFGDKNEASGFSKDSCGRITLPKYSVPTVQTSGITNFMFNTADAMTRMQAINAAQPAAVQKMIASLQPLATQIAGGATLNPALIDNVANQYQSDLMQVAQTQIANMDMFKNVSQNATQNGFLPAGAWYMQLSFYQDFINRSVSDIPTATGPTGMVTGIAQDQWEKAMAPLQKTFEKASQTITLGIDSQPGGANESWWSTIKTTVMKGDMTVIFNKVFSSVTQFKTIDGENALMSISRVGHWTLAAGVGAFMSVLGLMVTIGNANGIGAALMVITGIVVLPLLATGIVLTYVLPFMPFLIWVGCIIGWCVLVVEAVIAAPLWCLMHLTPGGDELLGSGAAGYRLVLSLLLRPVLLIFGLIFALTITQLGGDVLNRLFAGAFLLSQTDSGFLVKVFGGMIMAPIMYVAMMYTFAKKAFEGIPKLGDNIENWLGNGGPKLGPDASEMGGEHTRNQTAVAGVAHLGGRASDSVIAGAGKSGGRGMNSFGSNFTPDKQQKMTAQMGAVKESALKQAGPGASPEDKNMVQIKTETRMNHAIKSLGGSDTPEAESFMNSLNSNIEKDPNQPVENHITSAFNRELNRKFGLETGGNLKEISGGSYSGQDFENSLASYNQAWKKLDDSGMKPEDAKKKIEAINVLAKGNYKNDKESVYNSGTKKLSEYLNKEFDKIEVK